MANCASACPPRTGWSNCGARSARNIVHVRHLQARWAGPPWRTRALHLPVTSSFHTSSTADPSITASGCSRKPLKAILRKLHNRTQATLVPTRAMVAELQARGYDAGLMSRGVAIDQLGQALRRVATTGPGSRRLWRHECGRSAKNIALVVAAYRAIQARLPRARMVFVGDGRCASRCKRPARSHFAGVRKGEDLAQHYASGDVFLFPRATETFGNVVPEALLQCSAVVSYAHAAAKELIAKLLNGVLVQSTDEFIFVECRRSPGHQQRSGATATSGVRVRPFGMDAVYDNLCRHLRVYWNRRTRDLVRRRVTNAATPLKHSSA